MNEWHIEPQLSELRNDFFPLGSRRRRQVPLSDLKIARLSQL